MPPLRLTSLLQTALPDLSTASRAVVNTLGCLNGNAPSAREMADWVGLRDRYQLARALRRDGLPPLEQLAGWTRVLYWMMEAEASGASLRQLAQRERVDPAVAYRLVHRVTGQRWSQAQRAGLPVALLRFRERRGMRLVAERTPARARVRLDQAVGDDVVSSPARWAHPRPAHSHPAVATTPQHPAAVLAGRVAVRGSPFDVAVLPTGVALVTRAHAAAIDVLRLQPLGVIGSVRTGPVPTRVVVDAAGAYAYVTSQFAEEIETIDLQTLRLVGTVSVQGHPLAAAIAPDGHTLYVTTNIDRLYAISIPKGRIVTSVPIPMTCPQLTVHPSGRRVYVPCGKAGMILEIDAHTLCPLRRFQVGGLAQDVVVSHDGVTLYCANEGGWLNAIHLPTGRTSRLDLGTGALGLALSPDEQLLFVSLVFAGRVAVIDTETLRVRTTLTTGGKPRLIAFERSGRTAVVANEAGWVDVIH
jgi:YVTN family beta-propeller protein